MARTQKARAAADLSKALLRGTASLRDTLVLLNEVAAAAECELAKEDWGEVKKAADRVAKDATTIGMLWTQGVKEEDANQAMKTYFEGLQALLLLCHGCTVGAGPTLLVAIRNAGQQVVHVSLTLLTRAVSFSIKGAEKQEREAILPAHVGSVLEACKTLKRTPCTNRAAVGRSIAQVAASVKDVLREIGQIKEGRSSRRNACDCGHAHDDSGRRNEAYSHGHAGRSHSRDGSGHGRCSDDRSGDLHSRDACGHGRCELDHSHSGHRYCHHHLPHSHNHSRHCAHENGRKKDCHELSHSHDQCSGHCGHENGGKKESHELSHSHDHSGHREHKKNGGKKDCHELSHSHDHSGHCEHENGGKKDCHELSHSHDHSGHDYYCGHGDEGTSNRDANACVKSLDCKEELSEEEMAVVEAARHVVECSLDFIKQLLYVAAEVPTKGMEEPSTVFLENVLKHCKGLGVEVDEFGAFLCPPQQRNQLRDSIMKMDALVNLISAQVREDRGSLPEGLDLAFRSLQNGKMELLMLLSCGLQEALKSADFSPP